MKLMEVIDKIGADVTESQMFGCKSKAQGRMIALSCLTTGRDILSVPESYHLMNNKLSLQATEMLGRLAKAGGQYQIVEHSPDSAAIVVEYKGRRFEERLTWEDAQQEPFVYAGKDSDNIEKLADPKRRSELRLSGNYATPRRRMQHLWARVVSDAVRVIAPELVTGVYTPEEVADFSGLVTPEFVDSGVSNQGSGTVMPAKIGGTSPAALLPAPAAPAALATPASPASVAPATTLAEARLGSPLASREQVSEIVSLVDRLEISQDKQAASLAKRGVKLFDELTREQADEMLAGLRDRAAKLTASQQVEAGTMININGPISIELEDRIKAKIIEIAQEGPDGPALAKRIKDKIKASGIKLAQMRYCDAETLMRELQNKQLAAFFERSLQPAVATDGAESAESESPGE